MTPEEAIKKYGSSSEDLRCHGDKATHTNSELSRLNVPNVELIDYQTRLRAYKDCYDGLTSLNDPIAYSAGRTMEKLMAVERKRFHQVSKCLAEVFSRMDAAVSYTHLTLPTKRIV